MEENLVKKTCRELGITQKELAQRLGVSSRTLTNWNNGSIETPKMAINLMSMLHLKKDYSDLKKSLSFALEREV